MKKAMMSPELLDQFFDEVFFNDESVMWVNEETCINITDKVHLYQYDEKDTVDGNL